MRKAAKDILEWNNKKCFEHMVTYATIPPMLPKTYENSNGMRFRQADVLALLGIKYNVDKWTEASKMFRRSGEEIITFCDSVMKQNISEASDMLLKIAEIEEEAYRLLL